MPKISRFLLPLLLVGMVGCDLSGVGGEWGQFSPHRQDVRHVNQGMKTFEVLQLAGHAKEVVDGQNIYAGWQVWRYPTGDVYFYRGRVKRIYVKPLDTEEIAKIKAAQPTYWDDLAGRTRETRENDDEEKARSLEGMRQTSEALKTQKERAATLASDRGIMR